MCLKKVCFFLLVAFLFLFSLTAVLRAEEQETWYLISETELRSIEALLEKSETDRQSWESQARGLRIRAEKSEADSILLNRQLATARIQFRALEDSFNEYEAGRLALVSSKNGEIADLEKKAAAKALEAEKYKEKATARLAIIIAGAAIIALFIAFKVCRFFRLI